MDEEHVPVIGLRYWAFSLLASVFGAVMGDVFPVALPIGVLARLLLLLTLIVAVFIAERRDRSTSDVWYWLAAILMQIAAVRLGDLSIGPLGFNPFMLAGGLAVLLATTLVMARSDDSYIYATMQLDQPGTEIKPLADVGHWLGMMVGSILAAVAADIFSVNMGVGLLLPIGILSFAIAVLLWMQRRSRPKPRSAFWLTIVLTRADGVVVGDLLIGGPSLHLGLTVSSIVTGCLAVGVFVLWRPPGPRPPHA